MPYIYAIEETERNEKGHVVKRQHHEVDKDIAETHHDGRWKIISHSGKSATGWNAFNEREANAIKYGPATSEGTDSIGQALKVHDLVMTTIQKYADLYLCEVVSFTPQKVRVRNLRNGGYSQTLKSPEDIVRIDKNIFF